MSQNPASNPSVPSQVVCEPAKDPAVRYFLIAALLIGVGIWCWMERDKYPRPGSWGDPSKTGGYLLNHGGPFVFIPAGIFAAAYGIRFLRRKLAADDTGIGYEGDAKIAWNTIQELDATKLGKGFLHIKHGAGKPLTLDSWKLQNFRPLVAFIDQHVPPGCPKRT